MISPSTVFHNVRCVAWMAAIGITFWHRSDLSNELEKDTFKMEGDGERRLCNAVMKHLEESPADIKQQAVRYLNPSRPPRPFLGSTFNRPATTHE